MDFSRVYENLKSAIFNKSDTTIISSIVDKPILYGTLIVLGTTKEGKLKKFQLRRRPKGNGVVKLAETSYNQGSTETIYQPVNNSTKEHVYTAIYQMCPNRSEVIEYTIDSDYDLFQIGRSPRPGVDISVADFDTKSHSGASEISRFACRILADRSDPTKVELFAAGFDDSLQIFLGINAHKWYNSSGDPDGFTTNGVRILHPDSSSWAQLSVEGHLYPLNIGVKAPLKGSKLSMKNRLINGTLIELSGVTLLWQTDTDKIVEEKQRKLNEMFAQHQQKGMKCPISLSRLGVMEEFGDAPSSQAYVYSKCGHVQGDSQWGKTGLNPTSYTCCLCIQESEGRLPLRFVNEPRIHLDSDELQYCFNPCGHVVSLKTAEFWSELDYPNRHTGIFTHHCPFCKAELSQINPYVRLIFENYQIVNAGA